VIHLESSSMPVPPAIAAPLIPTAAPLTEFVTEAIGRRMQAAWRNQNKTAAKADAAAAVDQFVSPGLEGAWLRS
jgi:hypothetical protein